MRVFLKLFFGLSNNIKIVVVYPTILILKIASDFYHLIILKLALLLALYIALYGLLKWLVFLDWSMEDEFV